MEILAWYIVLPIYLPNNGGMRNIWWNIYMTQVVYNMQQITKKNKMLCKTKFYNSETVSETRVVFFNTLKNGPTSKPDCTLLI